MFIPDTEEERVENNTGSGTDFIVADSIVPETEEEESQEDTEDNTCIVSPETIVIDWVIIKNKQIFFRFFILLGAILICAQVPA